MEAAWVARKHSVRQGTPVCSRTDQGVESDAGNRNKVIHSIPPAD